MKPSPELRKSVRHFPRHPESWGFLADLYQKASRTDDAIEAKRHQLDGEGRIGPGEFLTAASWLKARGKPGDVTAAIAILDRAMARFGLLTGLQQSAIELECSVGRHEAALKRIDDLVVKYQPSPALSLQRADIFEATGRYDDAARACDSALAMLPADPSVTALRQTIQTRKTTNQEKAAPTPAPR
ncbi:MAG: tetratricopeptide repeat protein [Luteolibacter sp.]